MSKFWDQDKIDGIMKLYKDGKTYKEIGKIYKTTRCAIAGVVYRNRKRDHANENGIN